VCCSIAFAFSLMLMTVHCTFNTRAKDVLPNIHRTQGRPKSPPTATEWPRLPLRDVICSERVPFRRCRGAMGVKIAFYVYVTLTFDLGIQSLPSEGPNTSSL